MWEILWIVIIYSVIGVLCVPLLTRDAYRRSKLAKPENTEEQHRLESASQAWADGLFWPVYMLQHLSLVLLEKDGRKALEAEQTKRYLSEATGIPGWESQFTQAELDSQKRNKLTDEGG